MPKTMSRGRKSYVPRKRTAANTGRPTVKSPYGGRNNNDAYVRIEQSIPLVAFDGQTAFMRFRTRTDGGGFATQNTTIESSAEFKYHEKLYGFYEIRGMACKTTLYPESYVARADMFGGFFPNIPAAGQFPVVPAYSNLEGAAIHKQVALQGAPSSIYYAYSKDLKNIGAQFAFPTQTKGPSDGDKAAIVVIALRTSQTKQTAITGLTGDGSGNFTATATAENAWQAGDVIGEMVFTCYVRFHARVTNSAIALSQKEEALGRAVMSRAKELKKPTQSEMSYADLQEQVV